MTWYGGDFLEKLLSTYCVSPAGRYLGMAPLSWVGTGCSALDGHAPTSVRTGRVGREFQIGEVAPERRAVRDLGGGAGTDGQDLVRPGQLSASFALSTLASMFAFTSWRMVEAELYTHAQPPTAKLGAGRSASARAEFRRLTRETVRA